MTQATPKPPKTTIAERTLTHIRANRLGLRTGTSRRAGTKPLRLP